jgi:undecaprenyl-diphosphatase
MPTGNGDWRVNVPSGPDWNCGHGISSARSGRRSLQTILPVKNGMSGRRLAARARQSAAEHAAARRGRPAGGPMIRGARRRWPLAETRTLVVLLLVAILAWAFVEIARSLALGGIRGFDERLLLAFRSADDPAVLLGPPRLQEAMRDLTALGGWTVLAIITLGVAGLLWLQRHRSTAVFVLIAVSSGKLAGSLLKAGFDRPRPDLVPHEMLALSSSFPSGHSMMAALTYLTLAVLLARVQGHWQVKVYLIALAAFLTVAVGTSRIYLGVHWPSDVVAGWCAGTAWALSCWLVARWLQLWQRVEPEEGTQPRAPSPARARGSLRDP